MKALFQPTEQSRAGSKSLSSQDLQTELPAHKSVSEKSDKLAQNTAHQAKNHSKADDTQVAQNAHKNQKQTT